MSYYRLVEESFVGGSLRPVDAVVEYDGEPSINMVPATKQEWEAQQGGGSIAGLSMPGFTAAGDGEGRGFGIDPKQKWFDGHPLLGGADKDPLHARGGGK